MKQAITYLTVALVCCFLLHSTLIIIDGLSDEKGRSDYGVVLGNKVNEDGTLSERLKKRLDKGVELYNESKVGTLIVSGGVGSEGFDEGTVMAAYLKEKGVPVSKIIIDHTGVTTMATAINCRQMNLTGESITVITQYFHISRTKLAFQKAGFKNVKGAHAAYFELRDPYSIFREFFGFYKYLFL